MKTSHFCFGIFLAILLARLKPSIGDIGGILKPEITVKYIAVSIIFLNTGLSLHTEELTVALLRWDLHLFIQGFTFLVFPCIMYILVFLLKHTSFHPALLEGMTILSTMPPPVSSAIIMTRLVGGNVAASVFNSVFGSILGIFITPMLILLLLSLTEINVPTETIFQHLFTTVVAPLVIGQIIRNSWFRWLHHQKIPFSTIGQVLILFIIYTTFCATFSRTDFSLDTFSLVATVILLVCLHCGIMALLLLISASSLFNYDDLDCIAITYCGSHKSLTLGIPIIEIIFEGNPEISIFSIPLLIYNPMQIIIGGLSVEPFKAWLTSYKRKKREQVLDHHV